MKKNYVLDTNVLLHDPDALAGFEDNIVNIPITVIEEIDRFKKHLDEIGRNARYVSRFLDGLRLKGDLLEGIRSDNGGCVRVGFGMEYADRLPAELSVAKGDNRILAVCLALRDREDLPVVFVTKDTNLRIKANALGIRAEDYERGKVLLDDLYTGVADIPVARSIVDALFHDGGVAVGVELFDNQFVCLLDESNPSHTALGRYRSATGRVELVRVAKEPIWGVRPRNREQRYAMDALLDQRSVGAQLVRHFHQQQRRLY